MSLWVAGIEEGVISCRRGGNSFFKAIQGCYNLGPVRGKLGWGGISGGDSEKQFPLRSHQAGEKRQVVGSRIGLCIKRSGFGINLYLQCQFQPPKAEAAQSARQ